MLHQSSTIKGCVKETAAVNLRVSGTKLVASCYSNWTRL